MLTNNHLKDYENFKNKFSKVIMNSKTKTKTKP